MFFQPRLFKKAFKSQACAPQRFALDGYTASLRVVGKLESDGLLLTATRF